jgi:hypothetical protein
VEREREDQGEAEAPLAEEQGPETELGALDRPRRAERWLTVGVMCVTAVLCALSAWALHGEAIYAVRERKPLELGELHVAALDGRLANRFVRAQGTLEHAPTVRYHRLGEADNTVLSPVAGQPGLWVEHRVPERWAGPRFVPPSRFAGRLVRVSDLGAGYWGLGGALERAGGPAAKEAWVLLDGTDPRSSNWAVALALVLAAFAAWNLYGVMRLTRRLPAA